MLLIIYLQKRGPDHSLRLQSREGSWKPDAADKDRRMDRGTAAVDSHCACV